MSSLISDALANPRFQLLATAVLSGATVASLILGYQALEREERLTELKKSIPSLKEEQHEISRLNSFGGSIDKEDARNQALARRAQSGDFDEELILEQLARNRVFLTPDGLQKLRDSFVIVVGCGGVGSHCVASLARSGVSKIRLVDFDQVTLSSLNRHAVATLADVGIPKVQCLQRRLIAIAPWVKFDMQQEKFDGSVAARMLGPWEEDGRAPDYIVDAIDNIETKVELLKYCHDHKLPVISAMGAGCKSDPTRIIVGDIGSSRDDGLSRATRSRLKLLGITSGIPVVYSTEQAGEGKAELLPLAEEEFAQGTVGDLGVMPNFRVRILPVLGTMPAIFGLTAANHVILSITGYPIDYVPAKGRAKMYESILNYVQGSEERLARSTEPGIVGLKTPLTLGDIAFLSEELYHARSIVSGIPTKLVLVRWSKPAGPSFNVIGEGKDVQKWSTVRLRDLVCMTKEEANRHEKEVFKAGKTHGEVYDLETVDRVESKLAEAAKHEAFRRKSHHSSGGSLVIRLSATRLANDNTLEFNLERARGTGQIHPDRQCHATTRSPPAPAALRVLRLPVPESESTAMDRLTKGWVSHLRKTARQETASRSSCPLCEAEIQPDLDSFKAHVRAEISSHATLARDADIEEAFKNVTIQSPQSNPAARSPEATGPGRPTRKRPVPGAPAAVDRADGLDRLDDPEDQSEGHQRRSNKKLCSPPASVAQQRGSSPPTPGRSRARPSEPSDFNRSFASKHRPTTRHLYNPDDDARPKTPQPRHSQLASNHSRRSPQTRTQRGPQRDHGSPVEPPSVTEMIRQPETRPISPEQLVAEVKGIYAGLVMIESKCIEYDSSQETKQLSQEQFQALIALHRSVLHEHHDFFLASQHPSASEALRRLASKYAMPARMWRHGIHSFLELLRHKLPASLEHMLTFIYIAYSMMALLYETVPAFEDTWIECLGDLGRYRMAIEDDDIRDRETWTGVSRYWYSKASDKSPTTGRLYHHLAILARPNALQQLYFYTKSLCVPIPFPSARESIMTLFDPLLNGSPQRLDAVDAAFVRVHGIFFSGKSKEQLESSMKEFLSLLDGRIGSIHSSWLEAGYYVGISLCCLLLGFGTENNVLMRALLKQQDDEEADDQSVTEPDSDSDESFEQGLQFAMQTYEILPAAMSHLEHRYPWKLTSIMLNYLLKTTKTEPRIDAEEFPGPEKKGEEPVPLPEDYALRGLLFAEDFFPDGWFQNERLDETDRYLEAASKTLERQERILWIGRRIADSGKWLTWDEEARQFGVTARYDVALEGLPDNDRSEGGSGIVEVAPVTMEMELDERVT
ncbi:NADH:ubiquinone oxidoreductase subunit [Purpureocillium lavendulum]|uniref:NADH:ubiquinone oxidoreductase subunit n=1 Tax=Purpureocillium lavendulum TaxID=1247861 RepID=A0AB34G7I2_9HYPO|nr:NADH:ubiquinone oxidoreductase subunit [Purpureocillium lavendulum]